MTTHPDAPTPPARFPWWVPLGGLLLAALYLPTLSAPFDFIDDGNLVYPVPEPSLGGQVRVWWDRVVANVEHLGPFRPVLLAHWQVQANLFDADPIAWRAARLAWCALAGAMLLWLLRELKVHPVAALGATAAALWNPYRNEIWTSLTLAEGVAMPYALLALIAARKAATSERSWRWDATAVFGLLLALGCKNVFVALVPAMIALRTFVGAGSTGGTLQRVRRAMVYLPPMALPVAHYVYFQLHWKPGQYDVSGPSWDQVGRYWLWLKGAAGLDFLAAGALLAGFGLWVARRGKPEHIYRDLSETLRRTPWHPLFVTRGGVGQSTYSPWGDPTELKPTAEELAKAKKSRGADLGPAILAAGLLLACGFAVYLPLDMMAARYTMPGVWGADILLAVLLTRLAEVANPKLPQVRVAWAALAVGLLAVAVAGIGRQEKVAARSRLLWELVEHVEKNAPFGEPLAWVSGDSTAGELNAEEGIHFYWHLLHRGRGDVRVGLFDADGKPLERVELAPLERRPRTRVTAGTPGDPKDWELGRTFLQTYRLGKKRFECRIELTKAPVPAAPVPYTPVMPTSVPATGQGFALDPFTATFMKEAFANPGQETDTLIRLRPKAPGIRGPADVLTGGEK